MESKEYLILGLIIVWAAREVYHKAIHEYLKSKLAHAEALLTQERLKGAHETSEKAKSDYDSLRKSYRPGGESEPPTTL